MADAFNTEPRAGRSGSVRERWTCLRLTVRRHAGFTLIELLLVIAIIGVVSAVTVPNFVRSMQGNRLRAASRTVVMAGRYARSMSLLNQKEMDIVFDLKGGRVSIREATPTGPAMGRGGAGGRDRARGDDESPAALSPLADGAAAGTGDGRGGAGGGTIVRELDRVRIDSVTLEEETKGLPSNPDAAVIHYRSNGTCTPYAVRLVDESGAAVTVRVDMLAGVETEPM
ncbi:MAG: prepilin-type N-terminal cleavage/methylation domain-containing protein [Lentisphaerae bacterium]|nr:prepilin-type N-terminal cleavage/methylation domain-containing protein [Lentisphaerota bacterium]